LIEEGRKINELLKPEVLHDSAMVNRSWIFCGNGCGITMRRPGRFSKDQIIFPLLFIDERQSAFRYKPSSREHKKMTSPRTLLNARDIRAKKQLGQIFLSDRSTAEMIVARSALSGNDVVLEIGAGLGAITIPVARIVRAVYAVEIDPRLIDILKAELSTAGIVNVSLMEKSILHFDIEALGKRLGHKVVVMGNLPYNISSQILVMLINSRTAVARAVVMLQKELAQRITAGPGGRAYGRLTVMLNYCADVNRLATIDAALFFPKPKVDSEVLEITFKNQLPDRSGEEEFLFKVVKAAFGKRRKTLRNALAGSPLRVTADTAQRALKVAGIDPVRRAETLSVSEFVALSNCLKSLVQSENQPL
jgi:16S rRNA (adenine1518-N6/adenine1519-N6)-dimethyltransferase